MFYRFLYPLAEKVILFNVFKYITFRTFGALATSLVVYFLFGRYQILFLQKWQVTQTIRKDGPQSHLAKAGTPTMGGLLTLLATAVSVLLWMDFANLSVWLVLGLFTAYALIGFYDDYRKIRYGSSKGLPGRFKLLLQAAFATAAAWALIRCFSPDTSLAFPFFKTIRPDLGWWYLPFSVFVIVGASNAVNLTDGLDGLATGPSIISFMTYGLLAYIAGNTKIAAYLQIPYIAGAGELAIFCGALTGALIGFLWFNTYPAEIFMGDTGSLPLGGALGYLAIATKNEFLLVIIGGIFVLETLSVMTQVVSFKLTGKRVFLMAPIHHHFELKGWDEPKVIVRFWIISFVLALVALSTLKLR
jgi:phospho-N-acetylmuramoyl-pentapeptide-transferase